MTRSAKDVEAVTFLLRQGVSQAEVARETAIPRSTVRTWIKNGPRTTLDKRLEDHAGHGTGACGHLSRVPGPAYAYLLGLYLGDGCLALRPRGVYHLRITLDKRYRSIIAECAAAMGKVLPNRVGLVQRVGCVDVNSSSKHWPCLLPQHGPGPKHLRPVALEQWQEAIALEAHPRLLLRGLIHSDGYRGMNPIKGGQYAYPRYLFSNRSDDIRRIFLEACRRAGVNARPSNRWDISVARRADVAYTDTFVGPKT